MLVCKQIKIEFIPRTISDSNSFSDLNLDYVCFQKSVPALFHRKDHPLRLANRISSELAHQFCIDRNSHLLH